MKMRKLAVVVVVGLLGFPIHAAKKLKEADAPTTKAKPNGKAAAARLRAEWDMGELRMMRLVVDDAQVSPELKVKLGHPKPIHIFVYEHGSFNAYMSFLFFRRAIFLNSELLETGVSDNEVRWIVGRFIGYLRAREQAGAAGWLVRGAERLLVFNLFLLPYERAMVYTGEGMPEDVDEELNQAVVLYAA